jgi:hypothetical protein
MAEAPESDVNEISLPVRSWAFQIAVAAVCDDDGHVCEAL